MISCYPGSPGTCHRARHDLEPLINRLVSISQCWDYSQIPSHFWWCSFWFSSNNLEWFFFSLVLFWFCLRDRVSQITQVGPILVILLPQPQNVGHYVYLSRYSFKTSFRFTARLDKRYREFLKANHIILSGLV